VQWQVGLPDGGAPPREDREHRLKLASLREDYLSQVRRDSLSRGLGEGRNTPSGCALVSTGGIVAGLVESPEMQEVLNAIRKGRKGCAKGAKEVKKRK
jgi:hypothetical protein